MGRTELETLRKELNRLSALTALNPAQKVALAGKLGLQLTDPAHSYMTSIEIGRAVREANQRQLQAAIAYLKYLGR